MLSERYVKKERTNVKNIIIFGLEQFADMMYRLLEEEPEYHVCGFCVDEVYIDGLKEKNGLPVVAFEKLEEKFSPAAEYGIIFCIGYTDMNRLRQKRMEEAKARGYCIESYRHPTAIIQAEEIGEGNIFMEGVILGQGSKVGMGNIFWPMAHVAHHTIVGNYNFFTISCAVAGNITIRDYCVFGNNCTIKNGIEIKEGTLVGAGAYIAHTTDAWSVYVPTRSYKLEGKSSLDFKL